MEAEQPAAAATRPEILLVEDDDADAKAMTRAFRKAGLSFHVHRAIDGIEALAMLRNDFAGSNSCILISDVNMPRMNGHEFLAELRADPVLRRAIVFFMSTSADPDDIDAAYDRNVAGYLLKSGLNSNYDLLVDTLDRYTRLCRFPALGAARSC
ncbi:response regulator [Pseudoponticoccus marisrubri]|uniref:Response regulator n=2 Tax=Pseudoponticoccus marisrubri TaxID=1685382 RepID=A0A0W7WNF1_9RHOB|nr:response regulator [Pseudoponticoccus marisrubri]